MRHPQDGLESAGAWRLNGVKLALLKVALGGLLGKKGAGKAAISTSAKPTGPFTGLPIPPSWKVVERYALVPPFAYAAIVEDPATSIRRYYLDEVALSEQEAAIFSRLLGMLESELSVPKDSLEPAKYLAEQVRRIAYKYGIRASSISWSKILYYLKRDLAGFGILEGIMHDPFIEDISLNALSRPLFVYHRRYENLETNISFTEEAQLDDMISRLCHLAGKHVSTAFPVVQGTLPGRHRLIATFKREVSPYGATFTIRKFREDPITIIDMLNMNVVSHKLAAYLWLMMQNRATAIVVGSTGAGKTTMLNALLTLTKLTNKIVTIEEVQEINIAHPNWTALVSRESYAKMEEGAKEIGLFDLVKAAMRMRPDIIVVGEVRGEEAYVLFQAISTGHGGLCSLHADDAASAIQRLTSKPMDVPPSFIPFLDLVVTVSRVSLPQQGGGFRMVRRVLSVDEVLGVGSYTQVFRWDPVGDRYEEMPLATTSKKLPRLAAQLGVKVEELVQEIERRALILRWIQNKGIRNFRDLSSLLAEYIDRPQEVYQRAQRELMLGSFERVEAVA